MRALFRFLAAVGTLLLLPMLADAQVLQPSAPEGRGWALELTKPFFDGGDFGFATSILSGTLFLPAGERASFTARVPLVFGTAEGASSSTTLGNLEIGLAVRTPDGRPVGELSLVLPTAREFGDDDYATGIGFLSDFMRGDRYSSELWSLNGAFTPSTTLEGGGVAGLRVGASLWVPKGDGDAELLARYGAFFSRESGGTRFGLELAGYALISQPDLSFNERTVHEVGASVGFVRDGATPELFIRVPLDESVREVTNANVGIRVVF
jgi:hypothetical protein